MAKLFKVHILGTGLNAEFLVRSHEVVAYPSSTYHRFVHLDGTVEMKNDFGVSSIAVTEVADTSPGTR